MTLGGYLETWSPGRRVEAQFSQQRLSCRLQRLVLMLCSRGPRLVGRQAKCLPDRKDAVPFTEAGCLVPFIATWAT